MVEQSFIHILLHYEHFLHAKFLFHIVFMFSTWYGVIRSCKSKSFVQRHAEAVSLFHDVEVLHTIGDFNQKEKFVFDDEMINGIRTLIVYYKIPKNPCRIFEKNESLSIGFQKKCKARFGSWKCSSIITCFCCLFKKEKFGIPFVISEHWSSFKRNKNFKKLFDSKKWQKKHFLSKPKKKGLKNYGIKTK